MKKLLVIVSTLLLSACGFENGSSLLEYYQSYDGQAPNGASKHHSRDRSGRAHFPRQREALGRKVFIFDPKATAWAAYDGQGHLVKTGRASGGAGFCNDLQRSCRTPRGSFTVFSKKGADCESSRFPIPTGGAPMPYCMHFHKGYAIHGSHHVPNYNASHGCIRVLPSAARWLNHNFLDVGSKVIVKNY